ncbi:IucA/IucC family protein [Mammaliicoccus stepanovicii]|uniref:Siderophore biosynthesis protein n=1 Tax=Mammaliicoccus stepanovicii TaxID=643214 RepID=A0A239Y6F1_9STAP|nr:IucA/IucC family protein [Mammaliicoccus stepanovicii]PNZ77219.1 siderophore biosynthesis protein, IucA/IucC family [Mammaliicoccus stepanovicii]GGI43235.1 siderophore synthetase [Mammaliicoccus stepanovicii]SNV54749.1 Siderophore biosynthesis protein [Mammaliicoccus stepanovicii]
MEIDFKEFSREIHNHFQDIEDKDIKRLYEKAHQEVFNRINQLAKFEHIDKDLIFQDARMMREINDSIRNLTISYIQFEQDQHQFADVYQNIFEFVEGEHLTDVFFEQSVTEGHPFHPMTKTKLGFEVCDVINYSPEFRRTVKVIPVLCKSDLVQDVKLNNTDVLFNFTQKVAHYCENNDIELDDYKLLFIHDWQLNHFMMPNYINLINDQHILPLHELAVEANPLLSFRTLDAPELNSIIKTAVNVQATSAVRNVSPASIKNGLALSSAVEHIYRNNGYTNSYIQQDLAGGFFTADKENANKCSYMLRGRIPQEPGSHNIVCASLITKSFITDKPVVIECIETIMQKQSLNFEEATSLFLTQYTNILLESTYRLMLEEGISLEAHMQNSTMVIKDGLPIAIYVRDFGGVRLFESDINIDDSTGLHTNEFQDLLSVFSHAVLYNHLFQLIRVLESHHFNASTGYHIIREAILSYHKSYTPEIDILSEPTFKIKSLLKMRIYAEGYDYQYTEINNPLYTEAK